MIRLLLLACTFALCIITLSITGDLHKKDTLRDNVLDLLNNTHNQAMKLTMYDGVKQ